MRESSGDRHVRGWHVEWIMFVTVRIVICCLVLGIIRVDDRSVDVDNEESDNDQTYENRTRSAKKGVEASLALVGQLYGLSE